MSMSVSTYYYKKIDWEKKDKPILKKIENFCESLPQSGYRSVAFHLKKEMKINKKRVSRIMQKNGLSCQQKKKFRPTTNSNHNMRKYPNLLAQRVESGDLEKVIVGDITAFDINNVTHYVASLLDLTDRNPIGIAVSDKIDTNLILAAFLDAKKNRPNLKNYLHHTDSDSRYCSEKYTAILKEAEIEISMCKGNAYENAFSESFNGVLKRQEININEYSNLKEARESILNFRDKYVELRPHSSLGGLTPKEYAKKYLSN